MKAVLAMALCLALAACGGGDIGDDEPVAQECQSRPASHLSVDTSGNCGLSQPAVK
jgi:hypothetical protein